MGFEWANSDSRYFLQQGYLRDDETLESRVRDIAQTAEHILAEPGFADEFYKFMDMGAFSLSSPVWANFGRVEGLPISCNGSYVPDRMDGILSKVAEVGMMTKHGAGTSGYFGDIRSRGSDIRGGGIADGPVHFMEFYQTTIGLTSQGPVRRGAFAAYLPIEHPDAKEYLKSRSEGHPIQKLSIGVTVTDAFMQKVVARDPDASDLWARVIQKRRETGYPYVIFIDNMNKYAADVYRDKNMKILMSNLCTEIAQPNSEDESFVCTLASMNIATYDLWKGTNAPKVLAKFLDAATTEYIRKTEGLPHMQAANRHAKRHRSIGVGSLGLHTYLQSRMIPFESIEAELIDLQVHKEIRNGVLEGSKELAREAWRTRTT